MSSQMKHSCFDWWLFYGFTLLLTLKKKNYLKNDSVDGDCKKIAYAKLSAKKKIAYAKPFFFMSDFLLALSSAETKLMELSF